jgi:CH-like domain in sperm protein
MSYLLSQWLKKDVKLSESIEPASLDEKFKNGYLFGELLEKLKIHEASGYLRGNNKDVLTNNYGELEKILRLKLNIKLSQSDAISLISGKPGSAAKLLYQIKSSVASMPPKELGSKIKSKAKHLESYPSSPVPEAEAQRASVGEAKVSSMKFSEVLKAKLGRVEYEKAQITIPIRTPKSRHVHHKETIGMLSKPKPLLPVKVAPRELKPLSPATSATGPVASAAENAIPKIVTSKKLKPNLLAKKVEEDLSNFESRIRGMALIDDEVEQDNAPLDPLVQVELVNFMNVRGPMDATEHTELLQKMVDPNEELHSKAYLDKIRVSKTDNRLTELKKSFHAKIENKDAEKLSSSMNKQFSSNKRKILRI